MKAVEIKKIPMGVRSTKPREEDPTPTVGKMDAGVGIGGGGMRKLIEREDE